MFTRAVARPIPDDFPPAIRSTLSTGVARHTPGPWRSPMSLPKIVPREEWLAARKDLLTKEKDLTRERDALNIERRNLPMVEIEKDYVSDSPNGAERPADMIAS